VQGILKGDGAHFCVQGAILIAYVALFCPATALSMVLLRRMGRYVEMVNVSNAVFTISTGLLSTLDRSSSVAAIVGYLLLGSAAIGGGAQTSGASMLLTGTCAILMRLTVFACQAAVQVRPPPSDRAGIDGFPATRDGRGHRCVELGLSHLALMSCFQADECSCGSSVHQSA
jgi:hypothetical protein